MRDSITRDGRVKWTQDKGKYRQAEITTELAREAHSQGADWVIPIDADEFWYAPGDNLRSVLRGLQNELHTKVGECNEVIKDLHARLQAEVAQRDKVISELQAKLQSASATFIDVRPSPT